MGKPLSTASIAAFEQHLLREHVGGRQGTQPKLDKASVSALEKHLLEGLCLRLSRWGVWWYRGNVAEVNRLTGKIARSPSATLMQYAPHADSTGYSHGHPIQVDDEDAEALHRDIMARCTAGQARALVRFYALDNAPATTAERLLRHRAKRNLLGLR